MRQINTDDSLQYVLALIDNLLNGTHSTELPQLVSSQSIMVALGAYAADARDSP